MIRRCWKIDNMISGEDFFAKQREFDEGMPDVF